MFAVPTSLVALALAAACLVVADVDSAVRTLIVLAFLFVVPGLALVRPLRLGDGAFELVLAFALSVALSIIVSVSMLYAGAWSPRAALVVLEVITVFGAVLDVATARREPAP